VQRRILMHLLALVWLLGPSLAVAQSNPPGIPGDAIEATMVSVTDGDTIHVLIDGAEEIVRLIGMDAPERGLCFSDEATEEMARLIKPGRTIWLERDVSERDRYERQLAYVWLVRGSENPKPELVNERLVRTGFARAAEYPPDTARAGQLAQAMRDAVANNAGFWGACGGQFPEPEPTVVAYYGDCSPFQSFEEAQVYYQQNPGAQPYIDPDGNGIACEDWFGREDPLVQPTQAPAPPSNCHPSYPDVCIPPPPPDLNCPDVPFTWFTVLPPDPHGFDRDHDGFGCEG
jgi:micrococcal nuclease